MAFIRKSREILHDFSFFKVVKDTVIEDDSNIEFERNSVAHIGAVAVVPVLENGEIVLIKQYRSTINDLSLEAVAGRRDVLNEDLKDCAKRELIEEVAIQTEEIIDLGWVHTSPGFTDEKIYLFLATKCTKLHQNEPDGIEEKLAEIVTIDLSTAQRWIEDGTISDCKSIVNIDRAIKYLKGPNQTA